MSGNIGLPNDSTDNTLQVVQINVPPIGSHVMLDGCYISDGYAFLVGGGGISSSNSNRALIKLSNIVVEKNVTVRDIENTAGGYGGVINVNSTMEMVNSEVRNNFAATNGAGIYNSGTTILENVVIHDNYASGSAGGMSIGSSLVLKGTILIEKNYAGSHGGGLYFATSTINTDGLLSLTIRNCTANGNGGRICFNGGVINPVFDVINKTIVISGNVANARGGAILANVGAALTLRALTIENNTAKGGALFKLKES